MGIRIKICGLTRAEDIEAAIEHGAYALGFIVEADSPRRLSVSEATELSQPAAAIARRVAVTVNPNDDLIVRIRDEMKPDFIQLHGDETPQRVETIKTLSAIPLIKAIAIRDKADLQGLQSYEGITDYILLDAKLQKRRPCAAGTAYPLTGHYCAT